MQRIDHQRVLWIEFEGKSRRFAVPKHLTAAIIARDAYINFTEVRGAHGDFPKGTLVLCPAPIQMNQPLPPTQSAEDMTEDALLVLLTKES